MELNGTLFIKATAQGVLWAIHLGICACVRESARARAERESEQESEKDIEAAHAKAANFLIGN